MLDIKDLKKLVKNGAEQNILVFDQNAKSGVITARLLLLMQEIAWQNFGNGVEEFYVPTEAKRTMKETGLLYNTDSLNLGGELLEYYLKNIRGVLAEYQECVDKYLIIGTGETGVVLLGSC